MKKIIALNLFFSLFLIQNSQANDLVVNQVLTTQYWHGGILDGHARMMENGLNQLVKPYNCLQGELNYKVTKEAKNPFFGSSTPGKVKLTYQTKCFNKDLVALNFAVDSFGYDEDYTEVVLKMTTKNNKEELTKFCVYGLDNEFRNCLNKKIGKQIYSTQVQSEN